MARQGGRGLAHLVGSVPLESAEAVFRKVLSTLPTQLSRVPDGETGERRRWIYWQRTMLEGHPAMEVDTEAGLLELRQWDGSLLRRARPCPPARRRFSILDGSVITWPDAAPPPITGRSIFRPARAETNS